MRFNCSINDDEYSEIIAYKSLMTFTEQYKKPPVLWKLKRIKAHDGPLS